MNRRKFASLVGLSAVLGVRSRVLAGERVADRQPTASGTAATAPTAAGNRPSHIGMIIYDGMTMLDFAGPADIFSRPPTAKVFVLAKSADPVVSDTRGRILPDMALHDAPDLDLIFIGGGLGVAKIMEDTAVLDFLRERAPAARWVTSVCTGALVLGAAGLLRGYRATTHWTAMDVLPLLGAEPVNERVVIDRNRITGGGVTAGIDFGLVVAERLWGAETAQLLQLGSEYDPHPPFNAGSPVTAPSSVVAAFRRIMSQSITDRRMAAMRAANSFD